MSDGFVEVPSGRLERFLPDMFINGWQLGDILEPVDEGAREVQRELRSSPYPVIEYHTHNGGKACTETKVTSWEVLAAMRAQIDFCREQMPAYLRDQFDAHAAMARQLIVDNLPENDA